MSQSARVMRWATPSAMGSEGTIVHGTTAGPEVGGGSDSSVSPRVSGGSGLGATSYNATSPLKTHSRRVLSGVGIRPWGAVSSVWHENRGSLRVTPSKVATHILLGIPLDFLPPPPATTSVRSSSHADAYRGMPNFFTFGPGFFGAIVGVGARAGRGTEWAIASAERMR